MDVQVVELTADIALEAARLSVEMKLPMADGVILATARVYGAELWTQATDFHWGVFLRQEPRNLLSAGHVRIGVFYTIPLLEGSPHLAQVDPVVGHAIADDLSFRLGCFSHLLFCGRCCWRRGSCLGSTSGRHQGQHDNNRDQHRSRFRFALLL